MQIKKSWGATYQVPVEVKSKRAQAFALRWIMEATRKKKIRLWLINFTLRLWMHHKIKDPQLKKRTPQMAEANKTLLILDGKDL